jgi:hypothetical protein
MASVTKMASGMFSLVAAFTAVLFYLLVLLDQRLYIVKYMCMKYLLISEWKLYTNYRFFQIILRVKHCYTNREPCEVLTGCLSFGFWPDGDWVNKWH